MKIIVNKKEEVKEKEFPKLMISRTDVVVIMSEFRTGIVVSGGDVYKIGYHSESWCIEDFEDFNGTLTLSND